jgi:hypothetical protein
LTFQADVESYRCFLRIPTILTEPIFVEDLRHGAGFRALRRLGCLSRLNSIIEESVDSILSSIGNEELGKRGCNVSELICLDLDLKARFVSNEELMLTIGARFRKLDLKCPALWWDRCCDVGLLVGTFVHGLSNYESIRRDRSLPFGEKISLYCQRDMSCNVATQRFRATADATRFVFDEALEAGRIKAELEVQAAVAAAAKAALQREEDAALLRKGGAEAEGAVRNMPETQVDDAFEFDGTDTHFVTLLRMYQYIQRAARSFATTAFLIEEEKAPNEATPEVSKADDDVESRGGKVHASKLRDHHSLPMPDSRVLDYRVMRLLDEIDRNDIGNPIVKNGNRMELWHKCNDVATNLQVRNSIFPSFVEDAVDVINEYAGVGLSGNQCGISHRTLNDGSDFSFGSASNQISQLAYGTDAPRYLRALGVPMNVTRFAISGLLYADLSCVKEFMMSERLRYFGKEDVHEEISLNKASDQFADHRLYDSSADNENESSNLSEPISRVTPKSGLDEENWMHSSSRPKVIAPIDPVEVISDAFRCDAKLRACVCCAVGFFGFPTAAPSKCNSELTSYFKQQNDSIEYAEPNEIFGIGKFRSAVEALDPSIEVPDTEALRTYVETVLLPHCLRLCVNGNGPSTRNARGSHGDYETSFGLSIHPEPSLDQPSPLPDPCLRLQEHSLESVGFANALLRRVRLLRTCIHLCSDESAIPISTVVAKAKSKVMGNLDEMPIWWCPWIHDIGYMYHAATQGLFSVMLERSKHSIFSTRALQLFLRSKVLTSTKVLPQANQLSEEQLTVWIEQQASTFASLYQLERRLGLLCGEVTVDLDCEARFDFIPMFDHGGWPRK